ncbi:MAG TPA: SusC/RagA family protein, partial [Clostridiales bacterium]|nr:SusC/RagA family protein [Clostridiales bacterium]
MKPQEIITAGRSTIDVIMEADTELLDEVVIVGYGTQKKVDLTGAVSSVRTKDLPPAANTSISQMLAGRAAGLTSMQVSAQPGGSVSMQIRGEASGRSPLIVIDGIAQTGFSQVGSAYIGSIGNIETSLNAINPNDIESVEVLKDASATAIYGARAAGGVIIITTKRGKEGKAVVSYKGSISTQNYYGLPKMMNITEFMTEANEALKETWMRENLVYPYGAKTLDQAIAESQAAGKALWEPQYTDSDIANPVTGTDWYDIITRNGLINEQNISVIGGTDKTRYMSSIGYYNQKGIIENSDMNRFTLRFNFDQKFSKYVSGGLSANVSHINTGNVPLGTGANENSGIIRAALEFNPTIKVKDENGNYNTDPLRSTSVNPASMLEITDKSRTERLLMSSYIQIDPFKGFNVRALLGVDRNQGKRNYYLPRSVIFGQREGGYASIANNEKTDYSFNTIANWMKEWNDHSLAVLGGFEYQKFTWNGMDAYNSEFPYDGILWHNLNAGKRAKPGVGSYGGSSEMASYISRINYSYKNKYLLTLNGRADGSSNFAENNRWGFFSGIAVAWKIHEENFMVNTRDWLSELKLRAGYGRTGNDNITGINTYYTSGWNYILGNKYQTGIGLASIGNPDLTWEKQTDFNVGLDFGFLQQQITGSIEYFDRTVYDILGTKSLMSYLEVNTIAANLDAEKQSKGIEFSLRSNNLNHRDMTWTTDLNVTYYRDRWKKRDASWKPDIYNSYNAQFRELWYYKSDGLVSVDDTEYIKQFGAIPGTVKILDVNGYKVGSDGNRELDEDGKPQYSGSPDGKIDNADLVKVGVNTPVSVGLNNSLTYKGFDLNIYTYGMFNRWKINDTRAYFLSESFRVREGKKMYSEVIDRWSYKNMNSNVPSIFQANSKYGTGDFFLENAWFIRGRIMLGYSLPQAVIGKIASSVRFFVDAQNPFIITPYSGTDPET